MKSGVARGAVPSWQGRPCRPRREPMEATGVVFQGSRDGAVPVVDGSDPSGPGAFGALAEERSSGARGTGRPDLGGVWMAGTGDGCGRMHANPGCPSVFSVQGSPAGSHGADTERAFAGTEPGRLLKRRQERRCDGAERESQSPRP